MFVKVFISIFAQALLAHVAFGQCLCSGRGYEQNIIAPVGISSCGLLGANVLAYGRGLGSDSVFGFGNGFPGAGLSEVALEIIPTSGGAFPVNSASATAPTSISVVSENVYEGALNVVGELPFVSAVALEGVLPSAGAGAVGHSCGNGVTAMTSEVGNIAGGIGIGSAGIGYGTLEYGSGIIGHNCGQVIGHGCGCRF